MNAKQWYQCRVAITAGGGFFHPLSGKVQNQRIMTIRGSQIVVLLISLIVLLCEGVQHKKKVPYEVKIPKESCEEYEVTTCIFIFCSTSRDVSCSTYIATEVEYRWVCEDGWTGDDCDIPICTGCLPGQTCVEPNVCKCLVTGGACASVPCSSVESCYPGTCRDNDCLCPANFAGNDCLKIMLQPTITSCHVVLLGERRIMAEVPCGYEGSKPHEVTINTINELELQMNIKVESHEMLDDVTISRLSHVRSKVPLGVAESGFELYNEAHFVPVLRKSCEGVSLNFPKTSHECDIRETIRGIPLEHGSRLTISIFASLGGYKEGSKRADDEYSYFPKVYFEGIVTTRDIIFHIDTRPPTHCPLHCKYFPIQLENDIVSNPRVRPTFYGWDDPDSGIKEFQIKVYFMSLSGDGLFENLGRPIVDRILKPTDSDFKNYVFDCKTPGVHSLELMVVDGANNTAKARNIFVYTGSSTLAVDESKSINVAGSYMNLNTKEFWITSDNVHDGQEVVTISWSGYFVSDARFSKEWSSGVRPWDGEGIDDTPALGDFPIGSRTIDEMRSLPNGILNYSMQYYGEDNTQRRSINGSINFPSTSTEHGILTKALLDGDAIRVNLSAYDVAGSRLDKMLIIRIDRSLPNFHNWTLVPKDPDEYSSRVYISVSDRESGIEKINFTLIDETFKNVIRTGDANIAARDPPKLSTSKGAIFKREVFEGACEENTHDCYCTSYRACFSLLQSIEIDHCWIDRQVKAKNKISLEFQVINFAGLSTGRKKLELTGLENLHCRPQSGLTGGQIFAVALCTIILVTLLSAGVFLLVRIYVFKRPPPIIISNLRSRSRGQREEPQSSANDLYISADNMRNRKQPNTDHKMKETGMLNKTSEINFMSDDDINVADDISRGSVMVIVKGFFNDGTNKHPVAIKSLKAGASSKAIAMMVTKAELLAIVPHHENVVKVIGLIRTNQGHRIVMEYCEMNLKLWLENVSDVTPYVLDDMLDFAVGIARGVNHLHGNEIVHTRLAIRNVLVTKHFNQYIPKLTGFGTQRNAEEEASVPLRWLSPETLATIGKKTPSYSRKSDSWSYGITLWEIYTLGKHQPYSEFKVDEAKRTIISGKTMNRPEHCPPDIYEGVMLTCWATIPDVRPDFLEILRSLDNIKQGGEIGGAQYAAMDKSRAVYTDGS